RNAASARSWPTTSVSTAASLRNVCGHRREHARADLLGRTARVDERPTPLLCQAPVRVPDLPVEAVAGTFEPVAFGGDARIGDIVGKVEHDHDIGRHAVLRPRAQPLDRVDAESARDALICE